MPVKLQFTLEGEPPQHPFQHASGLRALVLLWIKSQDPDLSTRIHDANQAKPYSISPVWTDPDQAFLSRFELSILTDCLVDPVVRGAAQSPDALRLGAQRFQISPPALSAEASWEQLITPSPARRDHFAFRLTSPTAHHLPGDYRKSVVVPSPELYFGSWLGRWNVCCEQKIDEGLRDVISERVAVAACEGGTRSIRIDGTRTFIGFVGKVRFSILKPDTLPQEAHVALQALARFGAYSGTGVDTMRGMGGTLYAEGG